MRSEPVYVGIDVGKAHRDVARHDDDEVCVADAHILALWGHPVLRT